MPKNKLVDVKFPTDRWHARAVSPIDISHGVDTDRYGEVVLVHPGWGKSPERHAKFLTKLADCGFLPIGVDTRYAYADRQQQRRSIMSQKVVVGRDNPYFANANVTGNRWAYRRPTVLLEVCRRLGIERRSYVGHSDGARIVTLATVADPEQVNDLVVVNGAGTGDSSNGFTRLVHSNKNRIGELTRNPGELADATASAIGSTAYALMHMRRTYAEKRVIQGTDTWKLIDQAQHEGVDATVFHAVHDEMISFADSEARAAERPYVTFVPTEGGHSSIYDDPIQNLIISVLHLRTS